MYSNIGQMIAVLISLIFLLPSSYGVEPEDRPVYGLYAEQNRRQHMEDYSVQIESVYGTGFYAILDGHGGNYSSSHAKQFLTEAVMNELQANHSDHGKSKYAKRPEGELDLDKMLTGFTDEMELHLKAEARKGKHQSGSTCLMVVAEKNKLTVANVGDSRGVMCNSEGTAVDLSVDHKAGANENEEERIVKANQRLRDRSGRRIGGLAISRALGDNYIKMMLGENVIISKPEISEFDLSEYKPKFMILASDGLWDTVSSETAVEFIKERYLEDSDYGAKALASKAIMAGSDDNITVMIVVFSNGSYTGSYEVSNESNKVSTSYIGKMSTI